LFVRLELFDEEQAAGMLTWPHSGFHVHTAVWVPEDDRAFATRLARYEGRRCQNPGTHAKKGPARRVPNGFRWLNRSLVAHARLLS
jgi:hypothetical protein